MFVQLFVKASGQLNKLSRLASCLSLSPLHSTSLQNQSETERATGLGKRTRQEIIMCNQMTILRVQIEGRQTSPSSLRSTRTATRRERVTGLRQLFFFVSLDKKRRRKKRRKKTLGDIRKLAYSHALSWSQP